MVTTSYDPSVLQLLLLLRQLLLVTRLPLLVLPGFVSSKVIKLVFVLRDYYYTRFVSSSIPALAITVVYPASSFT